MYCQTCGAECQPGLNYCNRCGASVGISATTELAPTVDLGGPFRVVGYTIALTTIISLAILFIGLGGLASAGAHSEMLTGIGITGLLTIAGIDIALVRLLSRLVTSTGSAGRQALPLQKSAPKELRPAQTGPVFPDRLASVTEHTTRTFSPAYKEPRV